MNRLELVRAEIDSVLLNQTNVEKRREGYVHLYGVAQCCSLLGVQRGLDVELCTVIGMLHDIYTYKFEYVKNHALLGADEAEKVLRKLNVFSEKEIGIVRNAIINHSNKKVKHDKYSELIKDADVLQNSLFHVSFEVKHKDRLKKIFKRFGVKIKLKKAAEQQKN